ncbi:uncharacterized protein EV422DRAFT_225626 [Fimicolochytrium jonesii]|uniref:uncharacterized protein n=1 Tax=Fimicolochytrium jonesii TaxID=1396493 RepID=UPI0022FE8CC1|nr:uncharacterized protein EV422DRAFT_225626 [Fimicolochytrium jonesii]KAI8817467.1 hypothetical protein EV422DRAFT_225626 [Fimicolochytrium jonesii]
MKPLSRTRPTRGGSTPSTKRSLPGKPSKAIQKTREATKPGRGGKRGQQQTRSARVVKEAAAEVEVGDNSGAEEEEEEGVSVGDEESEDKVKAAGRVKKVYPPSGKKGKKFPDHTQLLSLISTLNATEESRISTKLLRTHKHAAQDVERVAKKRERQNTKRKELEDVKKALREEAAQKKKRRKKKVEEEVVETGRKRVSFAL